MSRVRVPQEALGARPVSMPGFSIPQFKPTVAGQLAGVLSGAVDATTQAVGFMSAVESMKAREAIIDVRNSREAIAEAEQNARQLQIEEDRAASLMRGQAGRDVDAMAGDIIAAFESGQMDPHIGRVVDNDVLNQIADGYAEPATAGWGADSEYTRTFKAEVRKLVTDRGIRRQAGLQEADRQENIANLQRDFSTASSVDEIRAGIEANKGFVGLNDQQFIEQIVTPVLQGRAAVGDTSVVELANALIPDTKVRAALVNQAESINAQKQSAARMSAVNDLSIRLQNAGTDIGTLMALRSEIQEFQANNPESRDTTNGMVRSIDNMVEGIQNSAIRQSVEQKEAEFKSGMVQTVSANLAAALASGRGYAALDAVNASTKIAYTKADGTTDSKDISFSMTEAEVERLATNAIHEKAVAGSNGDPVLYRRTRLELMRQNAMVDKDMSRVASAGVAKLSEFATASEDVPMPVEAIEGFNAYLDAKSIAPSVLSIGGYERDVYDLAAQVLDSGFVGDNPGDVGGKSRALAWSIRNIKNPPVTISEKQASAIHSAARGATAEWFDFNRDEEGRVADAQEFIRDKAAFYARGGVPMQQAVSAAAKDAREYGKNVNGHWTYTYAPMPTNANGKPLDQNIGMVAEFLAEEYGKFNIEDESFLPGSSTMSRRDLKFKQLPSGNWTVVDARNPYNTSIAIDDRGTRMGEISTSGLSAMVDKWLTDKIIDKTAFNVAEYSARTDLGIPTRPTNQ